MLLIMFHIWVSIFTALRPFCWCGKYSIYYDKEVCPKNRPEWLPRDPNRCYLGKKETQLMA